MLVTFKDYDETLTDIILHEGMAGIDPATVKIELALAILQRPHGWWARLVWAWRVSRIDVYGAGVAVETKSYVWK